MLTNVILDYERVCKRLGPVVSGDESFRKFAKLRDNSQHARIAMCQWWVVGLLETTLSVYTIEFFEKKGVHIRPDWHPVFLVFFVILTTLHHYSLNCEVAPIKFRPPKLSGKEHQNLDLQSLRI